MADNIMLSTTVTMDIHPMVRDSKVAKGELKSLNRALKSQSQTFKQTGMDADALGERQRLLGKAMEAQRKIVEDSEKAYTDTVSSVKDLNNMTDKEANAISRTRGAREKANFELKKYGIELEKVKNQELQLSKSSKELAVRQKELESINKRAIAGYKKMGSQIGVLKTQYKGLGDQINNNNIIMNKEKAVLDALKGSVSETSAIYRKQVSVIEKVHQKHSTLVTQQHRVRASMDRVSSGAGLTARGIGVMSRSFDGARTGMRGLMNAGARTSAMINRMGNSFRNVGLVVGGMAMGTLIQNFSTLIPLGGSLISVLAGVGGMAVSLGGAAIGMGGAFGIAGIAVKLFAGQAKTALEMVEDGTMGSSAALTNYKDSLSGLQNQWKALVQANAGAIFTTMANGINIARYALTTLNPFITKTANQIASFSKRMRTWVTDSNNAGAAFNMLNKIGPRVFQNILNSIFKVTDGLAHMAVQFAPLFTYMAGGLERMANSFNTWANSVGTDNGIAAFIEYTKTALPLTGQIFGNVFSGIISLFQAFSGHSVTVMKGMAGVTKTFKDWAANLSGTQGFKDFISYLNENGPKAWQLLKNIGTIIVGVIKGLAPVGSFMLDVAIAITGFVGSLVKANPILGAFLGILSAVIGGIMAFAPPIMLLWQVLAPVATFIGGLLGPAFTALGAAIAGITAPVWGAIAVIAGLIAALAWLNTKITPLDWGKIFGNISAWFQVKWNAFTAWLFPAWGRLMAWFGTAGAWFKSVWNSIWSGIVTFTKWIFGGLITFFTWVWTAISTTTMPIIRSIGNVIRSIFGGIGSFIRWVFNGIRTFFIWIWTSITAVVMPIIRAVGSGIRAVFGGIGTFIRWVFNGIKSFFVWIWTSIVAVVMPIIRSVGNGIRIVFGGISTFIKWVFNGIKAYFTWIWGVVKGVFSWGIQAIDVVVRIVFAAIGHFIRWVFNGILSFIKWVWAGIKNSVMFYVNLIKTLVTASWNILSRVTRAIFNGVKTFLIWVWQTIGVRVVNFVRSIWNGVKYYWNIVSSFTRTIFNAVKNFLIFVWTNIKNRVVSVVRVLWNNIRNNWNIISSFTRRIFNAVKNFLVWVWTNIKNRVVAVVRILWRNITTVWNAVASTTRRIFNYIKDWLIWVWNNIKNRVVSLARGMWNIVRGIWNTISSVTRKIFNGIKNFLVWLWTIVRDKVAGFARSLWSKVSGTWNNLTSGTKRIFNGVRNYLVDKWEGIKDKVTGIASSLWGAVKKTFTNMKNGLGGLADKIGGVITGMVKGIKKGLNSLIKGVNWVAEKLGVDKKIPQLSTGTGGTAVGPSGVGAGVSNGVVSSGGFATVNDRGPGNGAGPGGHQEVIQRANGTMVAPKGRDVTVPLGKGDIVHSGKAVQRAQKAGALPKFSKGTGNNDLLKDMKKKRKKKGDDEHGAFDAIGAFGPSGGGKVDDIQEAIVGKLAGGTKKLKEGAETGKNVVKAGAKSVGKIAGDLLEYVGNPGKLVSAMMKKFGVDFGNVKGQIPKDMMWDPMWKGLKGGVSGLFDGWLTEAEGAGDGGYIDLSKGINFGYAPSAAAAAAMGYPFPRAHHGIDVNYKMGEKLYSTMAGTATAKSGYNGGFGNSVWIKNGPLEAIYGHLSQLGFSGSKKVKPGSYLGKAGSTGDSTGPHLHYEMRKNGKHFNPIPWLKKNDGGGGKSKKASAWKNEIKQAAKATNTKLSNRELQGIIAQIQRESGGDAGVTQGNIGDINNARGTPAQGLLQYVPSTFKAYATKGGKNIKNGLHQLKAFFNNSNWRRDLPYGKSGWGPTGRNRGYAKGTDSARAGMANVFEKGGEIMNLRGGEQIIPNDVSINALKSMMSSDLFSRTQSAVYAGISQYADALKQKEESIRNAQIRLQNQSNNNSADITQMKQMMADMTFLMGQMVNATQDIAQTNKGILAKDTTLNGKKMTNEVSQEMALQQILGDYNQGITR